MVEMETSTALWIIGAIALVALLIGCLILMVLPGCARKMKERHSRDWSMQGTTMFHLEESPRSPSRPNSGNALRSISLLIGSKVDQELNSGVPDVTLERMVLSSTANTTTIVYGYFILLFLLTLSVFAYPPALWFVWGFFPSNSSVVATFMYLSVKSILALSLAYFLHVSLKRTLTETIPMVKLLTDTSKTTSSWMNDRVKFVEKMTENHLHALTVPVVLQLIPGVILGLRVLFLFVGTNVMWLDGMYLFSLIFLVDLLWVVLFYGVASTSS